MDRATEEEETRVTLNVPLYCIEVNIFNDLLTYYSQYFAGMEYLHKLNTALWHIVALPSDDELRLVTRES